MKIDNGVTIALEEMNLKNLFFEDMEQIETIMHEKMLENARKEAASIAYAIEHDKRYGSI